MTTEHRLVITAQATRQRRALAPSAWVVLEELALRADRAGVAVASTRTLAADLGISKDTVARSLRRLTDVGLLERVDQRDSSTGRFRTVVYVVDLHGAGLEHDAGPASSAEPISPPARSHVASTRPSERSQTQASNGNGVSGDQLDLFRA